jgi:DNA-binding phage protein
MFKKKTKLTRWNILDYLKTDSEIAAYLETSLEENDAEYLRVAVRDVIQALRSRNARH